MAGSWNRGSTILPKYYVAELILGLSPANERRRYFVTTSLIIWVQTYNQPSIVTFENNFWNMFSCLILSATCLNEMVPDTGRPDLLVILWSHVYSMLDVTAHECLHRCCGRPQACNAINYYAIHKVCARKQCGPSFCSYMGHKSNTRYVHISYVWSYLYRKETSMPESL